MSNSTTSRSVSRLRRHTAAAALAVAAVGSSIGLGSLFSGAASAQTRPHAASSQPRLVERVSGDRREAASVIAHERTAAALEAASADRRASNDSPSSTGAAGSPDRGAVTSGAPDLRSATSDR